MNLTRNKGRFTSALEPVALALLVGWYLMAPPRADSGLPFDAPISQWRHIGSVDSAAECEHIRVKLENDSAAETKAEIKAWHAKYDDQHAARVLHALGVEKTAKAVQCIASDDPRLKGK